MVKGRERRLATGARAEHVEEPRVQGLNDLGLCGGDFVGGHAGELAHILLVDLGR
jgi:hypothetical protein